MRDKCVPHDTYEGRGTLNFICGTVPHNSGHVATLLRNGVPKNFAIMNDLIGLSVRRMISMNCENNAETTVQHIV